MWPAKPDLTNQGYAIKPKTKAAKLNLQNQKKHSYTYQTKPTKSIILNQAFQTKPKQTKL